MLRIWMSQRYSRAMPGHVEDVRPQPYPAPERAGGPARRRSRWRADRRRRRRDRDRGRSGKGTPPRRPSGAAVAAPAGATSSGRITGLPKSSHEAPSPTRDADCSSRSAPSPTSSPRSTRSSPSGASAGPSPGSAPRTPAGPRWSFLDGPITANNPMGVHHAWGRTYKDAFQRYHAMIGQELRYQNGFDCQGLWVEVEVESELGFASKRDIETYGIAEFVSLCKERVLHLRRPPDRAVDPPRLLDGLGRPRRAAPTARPAGRRPGGQQVDHRRSATDR